MTGDAETGRLHIDQATCLSCPENGDCQGGATISNRKEYYALLTEGPVKPVAFDQTLKFDDPQRLVGLLRVLCSRGFAAGLLFISCCCDDIVMLS
jgi:hypothetical protein